jgi:hypothetical protein
MATSNSIGITFERAGRPSPYAPRRLLPNSDQTRYQRPSRGPA